MNVNAGGVAVTLDGPLTFTFKTTGTLIVLPPADRVIKPPYVPVARLAGFAVTVIACGVAPDAGWTESQFPEANVVAVYGTEVVPLDVSVRTWVLAPADDVAWKVRTVGLIVRDVV